MEIKYQVPRGTTDIMGNDAKLWVKVENIIRNQCMLFGYQEIRTPIFEHTEVFKTVNDSSDMVTKEMYTFLDSGERSLTLRPEGTKGVVRSFVEHKLFGNEAELPQKLYYIGPMFRYERPQKGRYRQFHQFGIEAIGAKSPSLDVECISLAYSITEKLGLKNVKILINSLGDEESRNNYRAALKEYFKPHLSELCPDCQRRYELNPLRILDCKADRGSELFKRVPLIRDYLNETSKEYFESVLKGLDELGIPYTVDDQLVRGLDYYSNTVFEAVPVDANGQQAAVFAGGQYDGLVNYFGGGNLPGVGFGMGLERMIDLVKESNTITVEDKYVDCYVITLGNVKNKGLRIINDLRNEGFICEMEHQNKNLKSQFKATDRLNAKVIIILGEDELSNGVVQLKNKIDNTQQEVKIVDVVNKVKEIMK